MGRLRVLLAPLLALIATRPGSAASAEEAVARDETYNFEVSLPPDKAPDWDRLKPQKDTRAHFRTEFTDTEPLASAEVQVLVMPLRKDMATRSLESIASQWSSLMEGAITDPRDLKQGQTTLGGQQAYFRDVKGNFGAGEAQVVWTLTRMGKFLYIFHVIRTYKAIGDTGLDGEINQIRDSFKFLKEVKVEADPKAKGGEGPSGPAGAGGNKEKDKGPDPEQLTRAEIKNDFWRFKGCKPEGLLSVPSEKFDPSETTNHMVAKMERTVEQTRITIRIYAQHEKNQQYTIEQHAERYLKYFKETYNEKSRLPEEVDKDFGKKFPLAKDAIRMKLTGRRTVPEVKFWYLAQCKNGRQYQLEIYITGAEGEKFWKNQIDDFMKSFRPFDD